MQLAAESVTLGELQSLLNKLQQRYESCDEVVQRIRNSPYWQSKKELEELVKAQREQVYLKVSEKLGTGCSKQPYSKQSLRQDTLP